MSESRVFHRYAEKRAGTQNKFYEIEAEEQPDGSGKWTYRYGRIGTKGQSRSGTSYSFEGAKLLVDIRFKEKLEKGYREMNAMEALASAAQDPQERETKGLPPVQLEIPSFFAGKSEERCRRLCEKYLNKLNLVRKSKFELSYNEYQKQAESVLLSYCEEFNRMVQTKAHKHLDANRLAWNAFEAFFRQLHSEAGQPVYGAFPGIGWVRH